MYVTKHQVDIVIGSTLDGVGYTGPVNGGIRAIQYSTADSTAGNTLSSTATLDIQTEDSAVSVLTSLAVGAASWTKAPALIVVNSTNGALANCDRMVPVANERLKVTVVNSSMAAQVGTFNVFVEGN